MRQQTAGLVGSSQPQQLGPLRDTPVAQVQGALIGSDSAAEATSSAAHILTREKPSMRERRAREDLAELQQFHYWFLGRKQ